VIAKVLFGGAQPICVPVATLAEDEDLCGRARDRQARSQRRLGVRLFRCVHRLARSKIRFIQVTTLLRCPPRASHAGIPPSGSL